MPQNKYHGLLLPAIVIMAVSVASVATPKPAFAQCGDGVDDCSGTPTVNLGPINQGGNGGTGFGGSSTTNVEVSPKVNTNVGVESRVNLENRLDNTANSESRSNATGTGTGTGTGGNSESRSNASGTGGQATANGGAGGNPTADVRFGVGGTFNLSIPVAQPQKPTTSGLGSVRFRAKLFACEVEAEINATRVDNKSFTLGPIGLSEGSSSPTPSVEEAGKAAFMAAINHANGSSHLFAGQECSNPPVYVTIPPREVVPPVVVPTPPRRVCSGKCAG